MGYFNIRQMRYVLAFLCIVGIVAILHQKINAQSSPLEDVYEPGDIEKTVKCKTNFVERRRLPAAASSAPERPAQLYVVTPTYRRVEQLAELTRLGQTLLTVPDLLWIVVEDADSCSPVVAALLDRMGMPYVHLASPMPSQYRKMFYVPRGVSNRRAALKWLRAETSPPPGVLYFLDDDNTIDIRLLEQIRLTKKVSMFPVGLVADFLVSSPIVQDGHVTGWLDGWIVDRHFPVDMAGFALNLRVLQASNGTMPYLAGYEEDRLLQALNVRMEDIEPLANQCTEILVWHTKTNKNKPPALTAEVYKHPNSNVASLVENMQRVAMATT